MLLAFDPAQRFCLLHIPDQRRAPCIPTSQGLEHAHGAAPSCLSFKASRDIISALGLAEGSAVAAERGRLRWDTQAQIPHFPHRPSACRGLRDGSPNHAHLWGRSFTRMPARRRVRQALLLGSGGGLASSGQSATCVLARWLACRVFPSLTLPHIMLFIRYTPRSALLASRQTSEVSGRHRLVRNKGFRGARGRQLPNVF